MKDNKKKGIPFTPQNFHYILARLILQAMPDPEDPYQDDMDEEESYFYNLMRILRKHKFDPAFEDLFYKNMLGVEMVEWAQMVVDQNGDFARE